LEAPFTIQTDHGALAWIQRFKEPEGQIARWVQKLQEYRFTIIHLPGHRHNNADALSRLPCRQCGMVPAEEFTALSAVTTSDLASAMAYPPEELRAAQLDDPSIGFVLTSKEANQHPDTAPKNIAGDQRLWQLWNQLTVNNGLLYRMFKDQNQDRCWLQFGVPQKYHSEVLASLHEGVASGHLGQENTFNRVREIFYWPRC